MQPLPKCRDMGKRPILLYRLPQLYGASDHMCRIQNDEVDVCENETSPKMLTCADDIVRELCDILMDENDLLQPSTASDAKKLYIQLRQIIKLEMSAV